MATATIGTIDLGRLYDRSSVTLSSPTEESLLLQGMEVEDPHSGRRYQEAP